MYLLIADIPLAVTVATNAPMAINIVSGIPIDATMIDAHRNRLGEGLHDNIKDCLSITMIPQMIELDKNNQPRHTSVKVSKPVPPPNRLIKECSNEIETTAAADV